MKTIIAAVDLSPATAAVLDLAAQLSRFEQAKVLVLHVLATVPAMPYAALTPAALDVMMAAYEDRGRQEMTLIEDQLRRAGVVCETRLVPNDHPVARILELAVDLSAAWLVLGAHGHGRLYEAFMGSTALGVLRGAPCPVAIVPPGAMAANQAPEPAAAAVG